MANTLVCCGGTGAHVALAFMRLHALGHPLGCFRHESTKQPLALPDIHLVDQDHADGAAPGEETAWQKLAQILQSHPSRHEWGDAPGKRRRPRRRVVTPLPVGPRKKWFNAPNDRLATRFDGSQYLDLVASPRQQDIQYSRGMMGSPAIGSLLFKLKEYDFGPDGNYDRDFDDLLRSSGRITVVGSGVGGTGSSVAPTLARMLAERDGTEIMAVMLLQWFRLVHPPNANDRAVAETRRRNMDMEGNASSGLRYYGSRLANSVATVPVGVPDDGLVERLYAGDNQQPLQEAYPHAVAALACMRHYLSAMPSAPGLYHMDAADARRLGGATRVPGGTLSSIATRGEVLHRTARILGRTLILQGTVGKYAPAICGAVAQSSSNPGVVGESLVQIADEYSNHLQWLYGILGVDRAPRPAISREAEVRGQLAMSPLKLTSGAGPRELAGQIFRWTAAWICQRVSGDTGEVPVPAEESGGRVYWPPLFQKGLAVAAGLPGELTRIPSAQLDATLDCFVDPRKITHNGWPDAFASASHFGYSLDRKDPEAMRKLELLLAGLLARELKLEQVDHPERSDSLSIDRVLNDERERLGAGLARHVLVQSGSRREVLGFTAPRTLFCPAPGVAAARWGQLWARLTGFDANDWMKREWSSAASDVRRAQAWINACKKRHPGEAPAWTGVFPVPDGESLSPATYGTGAEVSLEWDDKTVSEFLPTADSGDFNRADSTYPETEDASAFLADHGKIVDDGSGKLLYEVIDDLRLPQEPEVAERSPALRRVRAIWREHLETLQARGVIVTFGEDRSQEHVYVLTHKSDDSRELIVLVQTLLLDRETISVREVTPLEQRARPGMTTPSSGQGPPVETLYPDLPLKSRYLDLAIGGEGPPEIIPKASGDQAVWHLRLRGRGNTLPISVHLPHDTPRHTAHWMVWPLFHSSEAGSNPWRAYYVYERCSDHRLVLDVLYRDPEGDERASFVRRNPADQRTSYAVNYDIRRQVHAAGPPVAVSVRDYLNNREHGIYRVRLKPIAEYPSDASLGIDFGTSHSSAAYSTGSQEPQEILGTEGGDRASLSYHISQDWEHVMAPRDGLLALSAWMPTYAHGVVQDLAHLVPTELLTVKPVHNISKAVHRWIPLQDYGIPPTGISRRDFTDHVIANFKWDTLTAFVGRERELRKIYLDRLVELATAEVAHRLGTPSKGIRFTFTYPLRTPPDTVREYRLMLEDVMNRGTESLGLHLSLLNDDGLFNESHAARVGTGAFPEVRVVADLGGGTLDLFISAQEGGGVRFKEAVDSVRLGGNLLLQTLARELIGKMPSGWVSTAGKEEELAMQLAAWMRGPGSPRLFGPDRGGTPQIESLGLAGFVNPADKRQGRQIIDRYFYLVGEYVARSLTAYLATHWYALAALEYRDRVRIRLYLRGNGWRLWTSGDNYGEVQQIIAQRVSDRVRGLWTLLDSDLQMPSGAPGCAAGSSSGHPKLDVVRNIVGKSLTDAEVRDKWLSYTMVDIEILGPDRKQIPWYGRIPFRTGGSGAKAQITRVRPGIPLSGEEAAERILIEDLGENGRRTVNTMLDRADLVGPDSLDLLAPVGASVWEEAFKWAMLRAVPTVRKGPAGPYRIQGYPRISR